MTIEGTATVSADPLRVGEGVRRYTERFRSPPPEPPDRVVVEIAVARIMKLNV